MRYPVNVIGSRDRPGSRVRPGIELRVDSKGVTIQIYRPAGRPQ